MQLPNIPERSRRRPDSRRAVGLLAAILLLGLAAGCAATDTQSFIAPAAHNPRYDGFLAYGAFRDLGVEGRFEKALCERLAKAGHACVPMLAVATPTRPQDAASRQRAAHTSGAQAIVIIELADTHTTSRQVLTNGAPGYKVSLVDVSDQKVVAQFAIEGRTGKVPLASRAAQLADNIVVALQVQQLLYRR